MFIMMGELPVSSSYLFDLLFSSRYLLGRIMNSKLIGFLKIIKYLVYVAYCDSPVHGICNEFIETRKNDHLLGLGKVFREMCRAIKMLSVISGIKARNGIDR